MAYPIASGQTAYSGVFIPEIWSTKMIEKYYDGTVLSMISNTDYEGEIRNQGDKVIIRTMPTLEINDYKIGDTLINQRPIGGTIEMLVDKGFYWSAVLDDVVKKQQDIEQMNTWATDASEQMKIKLDRRVLASIYPEIAANNKGVTAGRISNAVNLGTTGAPVALTRTNVLDTILYLGQVLDEENVGETGRFLVMPYWATTLLKLSDIKDASLTGDGSSPLRNGRVGMIDRFTVYNSNLLPTFVDGSDATTQMLAGTTDGMTFATQLTNTESLRAESTFGEIMRGLMVYGHKVVKPEALAAAYVKQG